MCRILRMAQKGVSRLLLLQMMVTAIIGMAMGFIIDICAAYSALVGGIICIISTWYFGRRFFVYSGARVARRILRTVYQAELVKFLLTVVLFIVAIKFLHIRIFPFFMSYIIVQSTFWFTPWLLKENNKTVKV